MKTQNDSRYIPQLTAYLVVLICSAGLLLADADVVRLQRLLRLRRLWIVVANYT